MYEYERKFAKLSCFAPHMVDTEARKARHFERGLRRKFRDWFPCSNQKHMQRWQIKLL